MKISNNKRFMNTSAQTEQEDEWMLPKTNKQTENKGNKGFQ